MSIIAKKKDRFLVPAGSYVGRCISMIHIGHVMENYMGDLKENDKLQITWELPTKLHVFHEDKGEQPCVISQELTLSMHEKSNLRRLLAGWRGRDFTQDEANNFDISKLIGKPCMLSIIHKATKTGNMYPTIQSIITLPKGMECPPQVNPSFEFSYNPFDEDKFNSLPEWLQAKASESKEYKKATGQVEINQETKGEYRTENDPLPF